MGRDDKLYFAGTINGGTGVSVFSRDPKDIDIKLGKDRAIETDNYTKPFNIGSVKMSWYGRFQSCRRHPGTGSIVAYPTKEQQQREFDRYQNHNCRHVWPSLSRWWFILLYQRS
ncbi:MAG: hypothetical protein HC828_00805 [Blastochloris sp.]|nr:hypothetical protein [Blastochloris sp.]